VTHLSEELLNSTKIYTACINASPASYTRIYCNNLEQFYFHQLNENAPAYLGITTPAEDESLRKLKNYVENIMGPGNICDKYYEMAKMHTHLQKIKKNTCKELIPGIKKQKI